VTRKIARVISATYRWHTTSVVVDGKILLVAFELRRRLLGASKVVVYYSDGWHAVAENKRLSSATFDDMMNQYLSYSRLINSFPSEMREMADAIENEQVSALSTKLAQT